MIMESSWNLVTYLNQRKKITWGAFQNANQTFYVYTVYLHNDMHSWLFSTKVN